MRHLFTLVCVQVIENAVIVLILWFRCSEVREVSKVLVSGFLTVHNRSQEGFFPSHLRIPNFPCILC
jgi:hypothetical protein